MHERLLVQVFRFAAEYRLVAAAGFLQLYALAGLTAEVLRNGERLRQKALYTSLSRD